MEYQFIINPNTNRKCRVDSKKGRNIIKNYVKMHINYGGTPPPSAEEPEQRIIFEDFDLFIDDLTAIAEFIKIKLDNYPNFAGQKYIYEYELDVAMQLDDTFPNSGGLHVCQSAFSGKNPTLKEHYDNLIGLLELFHKKYSNTRDGIKALRTYKKQMLTPDWEISTCIDKKIEWLADFLIPKQGVITEDNKISKLETLIINEIYKICNNIEIREKKVANIIMLLLQNSDIRAALNNKVISLIELKDTISNIAGIPPEKTIIDCDKY